MTKDELVEKCARAMYDVQRMDWMFTWDAMTPLSQEGWMNFARAALAIAMPAAFEMAAEVAVDAWWLSKRRSELVATIRAEGERWK